MKRILLLSIFFLSPSLLYAAEDVKTFRDLVNALISLINAFVPILLGIAFLAFVWGVVVYLWSSNPQKLKEARGYLIFGIIGFTVMLSVWGLAFMFKNLLFPTTKYPSQPNQTQTEIHSSGYYNPNDTPSLEDLLDRDTNPDPNVIELVI